MKQKLLHKICSGLRSDAKAEVVEGERSTAAARSWIVQVRDGSGRQVAEKAGVIYLLLAIIATADDGI